MKIACAEKQKEDCAARVQNILAQDPVNFEAVYQDALISASKGDTSKAIRELEFLSNSFPRNALVRYQLASAYLLSANNASEMNARNAIESAENRLSDAIKLDPKLEPAVLLFAELKIRKGSAAAAIEPLRELITHVVETWSSALACRVFYDTKRRQAAGAERVGDGGRLARGARDRHRLDELGAILRAGRAHVRRGAGPLPARPRAPSPPRPPPRPLVAAAA